LSNTWAKVEYLLSLFDQRTAQLYFDAYRGLAGHLLWTYVPTDIDPATWASAVPFVSKPAPTDQILVVSMAARESALRHIRRDLHALSTRAKPIVYLRRRGRHVRLVMHSPHTPAPVAPASGAYAELRGGLLALPAIREVVRLRISEGRLMQAFSRLADAGSSEHSGRIRTPLVLEQFGVSIDSDGNVDGVATWAWCRTANIRSFVSNPYGLAPALWREGECLQIVDALGNWRSALSSAVKCGRLTEEDHERLSSCQPLMPKGTV
jgi:hypothetical protein